MGLSIAKLVREAKRVDTIVTKPVNEWLLKHGDDPFSPDVVAWVADQIGTQPRIRTGSFSGASAGKCLRAQELAFASDSGEVIDTQLRNIFNDGKWRHLRWQAMLLEVGVLTDAEYPVFWRSKYSRGTIDGRGVVPDDHPHKEWRGKEFGFELKGVSTFQFKARKDAGLPEDKHWRQIHHYFILGNFDLFSYVMEDKTTQEFYEMVLEPDPKMLIEAQHDIDELAKAVDTKVLHPQLPDCAKQTGVDFRTCPFGQKNGPCMKALTKPPKEFSKS